MAKREPDPDHYAAWSAYWRTVEKSLTEQYHRNQETAAGWVGDEIEKHGGDIPDTPPERMAQEIFMGRSDE